ncbi:MAG: SpoIID/LytB domain-containing protein [Firmicutes bacterium]|nr:SpoIID/LytB domain-containing protein [Bacillota bacterium]
MRSIIHIPSFVVNTCHAFLLICLLLIFTDFIPSFNNAENSLLCSSCFAIIEKYPDSASVRIFSVKKVTELHIKSGEKFQFTVKNKEQSASDLDIRQAPGNRTKLLLKSHSGVFEIDSLVIIKFKAPASLTVNSGTIKNTAGILIVRNTGEQLLLINKVKFEDYIAGVVSGEIPGGSGEVLAAQAVVSRSFSLANLGRHKNEGFDFCDSTHCQYFRGYAGNEPAYAAAVKTSREVLFAEGRVVESFYHSNCGGFTSNEEDVLGQFSPGITSVMDRIPHHSSDLCKNSVHYRWKTTIPESRIAGILNKEKITMTTGALKNLRITGKDRGGRIIKIRIEGTEGYREMSGYDFWQMLGSHLGWGEVESASFIVIKKNNSYVFEGKGLGHGMGMCQTGAIELGRLRWNYRKILKHYFPKADIRRL